MNYVVEYYSDTIITKSRGILEYVTLGHWGRICTLDFSRRILEETTFRFKKVTTRAISLNRFDAVDYSYKCLGTSRTRGVDHEADEFRVGLRFASDHETLPVAVFRGTTSTPSGLSAAVFSMLPGSWSVRDITHEVASRSLANMLCQKLNLKLAIW